MSFRNGNQTPLTDRSRDTSFSETRNTNGINLLKSFVHHAKAKSIIHNKTNATVMSARYKHLHNSQLLQIDK